MMPLCSMISRSSTVPGPPVNRSVLLSTPSVKWSQKTGQSAKVNLKSLKGYEDGQVPEFHRPISGQDSFPFHSQKITIAAKGDFWK